MNRRSFFGSVIGLVVSTPFVGKRLIEPPQKIIQPFKMCFREERTGELIQAPAVKEILRDTAGFQFIAEPLEALQTMVLDRAELYTMDDILIIAGNFSAPVPLVNGDTFKCTQTVYVDNPFLIRSIHEYIKNHKGTVNGGRQ